MNIPSHVAIIMDGNGRWAQEKGLPRYAGHREGVKTLKKIIKKAGEMKIPCLTVYAFSTENWRRPRKEVDFLMKLFKETLKNESQELASKNVRVNIIGRRNGLSKSLINAIEYIEKITRDKNGMELNIAFNYGGRAEIVDSVKKVVQDVNQGLALDELDENNFSKYLYNPRWPEVELLIRTGGEMRISNYMLWQLAYAELYFIDKCWPDFNGEDLEKAIKVFQQRDRRFGGLPEVGDDKNA
ncbi:isoprenyl transferase [Halothermothrix orenii]|uniref:Isoprenyl transferase n=1 Tax=Halothermothrix orenii (strain H 168 / OCM 544 / DSM 9562) TaxID=373903 RepID=B8CW58_HALOH|nr:isoprenyl transferase [Halothermothrix orenii]ACL69527.1 undecaprenyl diphosphate synthase [Halothermothrix orenii H 168]